MPAGRADGEGRNTEVGFALLAAQAPPVEPESTLDVKTNKNRKFE